MMARGAALAAAMIRTTIGALALAVVFAEAAHAQPAPKLPVIGILATGQLRSNPPYPALERALRELGLVDGQNVRIEFRMAEGRIERLPGLAVELVRSNVDLIVAGGTFPSLEAARRASSVVPIVMIAVDYDPLATRVVSSLNRPGGNITGVFVQQIELTAKRMELLKEIAPKARRVAILSDPFTVDQLKTAENTARTFGLRVQPIQFRTLPYDYAAAFARMAKERSGAALVTVGPNFFRDRAQIVEVAGQQRIPTMFPVPEFADAGGLIAYGANLDATFASAASHIQKILNGDVRFGDGRALAPLATELTRLHPDLILAVARPGVTAMHAATSTIPLVALDLESDPVASGFVKTLPQPGGNLTGVFMDFPELAGKWLEILKMAVPALARVAVLWDPAAGPAQLDAARRAAQILKLTVFPIEARSSEDIERAFRAAMRERPNGMIVLTSPIFNTGRRDIIAIAARHRLPTLVPFPGYAKDGGLVAYGPEVLSMYGQAATLAIKILAGRPPAEIPVERPTNFTLSVNLTTAKALGLTIPTSLLLRADQVIE